jgi:hypothetical protein
MLQEKITKSKPCCPAANSYVNPPYHTCMALYAMIRSAALPASMLSRSRCCCLGVLPRAAIGLVSLASRSLSIWDAIRQRASLLMAPGACPARWLSSSRRSSSWVASGHESGLAGSASASSSGFASASSAGVPIGQGGGRPERHQKQAGQGFCRWGSVGCLQVPMTQAH